MYIVFRLVAAIIAGLVIGSVVNMSLILVSSSVIPPPDGADMTTLDELKASMHLLQPKHFIFPFLAHSLGTFIGALVATVLMPDKRAIAAYVVGLLFLFGGIANAFMLPAPMWYNVLDLILAYLPAAWLAHRLGSRIRTQKAQIS